MKWFFCFCLLLGMLDVAAQQFLQMEKVNSLKVRRYYIGDEITYRMGEDKDWQTSYLEGIRLEDGIILLSNRYVKIGDISSIKTFKGNNASKALSGSLYTFGATWAGYALVGSLVSDYELSAKDAIVVGTSVATGFLIRQIFKSRTFKINKRYRLRLLDLTPE